MNVTHDLAVRLRQAVQGCTIHSHGPVQAWDAVTKAEKAGETSFAAVAEVAVRACTSRISELMDQGVLENDPRIQKERHTRSFIEDLLFTKQAQNRNTPKLTVDVIVADADNPNRIVLIERKNPPHGWALPGGFVEVGETVEQGACRELFEETNLKVDTLELLGVYSDPARDARFHTVSTVFATTVKGGEKSLQAKDDAANAKFIELDKLPQMAFDHGKIIEDYRKKYNK